MAEKVDKFKNDMLLVKAFLDHEYETFQTYLEEQDIKPTEAEVIIDNIDRACNDPGFGGYAG